MFDLGFFEILVIAIVGLVVIGPERLPETVRAVGLWVGRLKRSLRETRSELERQVGADDIRRQLHNEEVMRSLEKSRQQIEDAVQEGALPRPKPKRQYKEEKELPDHAHGEASANNEPSASTPAPDADDANATKAADESTDSPEAPDQKRNS
ncbi:Sec-independent protein translocase protein TatB [Marinimicrobium sp. ABcell2]|uniref:Sec-independent protein translocase protein TatB n=1 Tax=Marinimicrobium sp. ABcell2 TaxID=3069751 RepID=UPI0027B525ED|nr:Sec-independent protein translocase protein TatB [Marinimicrobium sp. ABcell2]MDQ2076486.1 Sec-independent protein translocase protein TatB [Marinimicrobium sp. ABcell2]